MSNLIIAGIYVSLNFQLEKILILCILICFQVESERKQNNIVKYYEKHCDRRLRSPRVFVRCVLRYNSSRVNLSKCFRPYVKVRLARHNLSFYVNGNMIAPNNSARLWIILLIILNICCKCSRKATFTCYSKGAKNGMDVKRGVNSHGAGGSIRTWCLRRFRPVVFQP